MTEQNFRVNTGYKTFTEYAPSFAAWDGNIYGEAQTRAIIERFAVACSKLKPEFVTPEGSGGSLPRMQRLFNTWPNDMMTWPGFLYRLATIYETDTTAYVIPEYDRDRSIVGFYPLKPSYAEVLEYEGEPWIRFRLMTGDVIAYPFYDVVIVSKFQLESDIFGGGNLPLTPTLRLMDAQRQAEELALKNGSNIRFIGKLSGMVHTKDMNKKREQFAADNLQNNTSGLMLYDQTFEDIKELTDDPYVADKDMMERIDKALFAYFGINESILTNDYSEEQWGAWYESKIEPFALHLGEGMSARYLTATQRRKGNRIMFSSSYLEYASPKSKREMVKDMAGMSVMSINEGREVLQLPPIKGGEVRVMRGEYYLLDKDNNILAESGGHTEHSTTYTWEHDDGGDLDEPPEEDEQ